MTFQRGVFRDFYRFWHCCWHCCFWVVSYFRVHPDMLFSLLTSTCLNSEGQRRYTIGYISCGFLR
ncbi:unnamed protein product [Meloidogyne enterolobii]|uniref:Uncharacterized protein n=1 Tax=Meloidogyne enterolobii TaxID=390850 RepID=A0ACB1AY88_MELEN